MVRARTIAIGVLVLLAAMPLAPADAAVETRVTRKTVPITDSFRVVYSVDGASASPDFAPLERDFEVLGTAQSTNMSIVNGRMEQSTSFTVDLMPRREGELTLPPIDFGNGQRSEALTITVVPAPDGSAGDAGGELFLEVEAEPATPYVQAQIRYTLRVFRSVPIGDAALTEPQILEGEAVIERIGEDTAYETTRGGVRLAVVERRYAIFPQSSGKLVIAPLTFEASIGSSRRSMFDPFSRGRRVRVRSEPMEVEVQSIPASFTGRTWMPAEHVELVEQWPARTGSWRVGEPLTRTLTLRARGLASSQLADIAAGAPDGLKQYADQPQLETTSADGSLIGTRRETVALIPERPGQFELPAIEIPWWNTSADRLEYARVPGRTVTVLAAAGAPAAPAPEARGESGIAVDAPAASTDRAQVPAAVGQARPWIALSAVLALAWLATLMLWWRSRHPPTAAAAQPVRPLRPAAAAKALERACSDNDAPAATRALLDWAQGQWPGNRVRSLGEVAARVGGELQIELHRLSRARYAAAAGRWRGDALWQAFRQHRGRQPSKTASAPPPLEPLYRQGPADA